MIDMVDVEARHRAAELLQRVLTSGVSNYELDDMWPESKDEGIVAIGDRIWCFYDDFPEQIVKKDSLPTEILDIISRCWIFLRGSTEYSWPAFDFRQDGLGFFASVFAGKKAREQRWSEFKSAGDFNVWPFLTRKEYERESSVIRGGDT